MRDDIAGGIRNALEHGATLEQAAKSFISAGYPEREVREATRTFEGGTATAVLTTISSMAKTPELKKQSQPTSIRNPQISAARTSFEVQRPRQRPSLLIIVLMLILLLSVAGFIFSLLFKKEIAAFLAQALGG